MFTEKLVIITSMFASIIDVVSKVVIITSVKNVNSNEHALDCIGRRKEKSVKKKWRGSTLYNIQWICKVWVTRDKMKYKCNKQYNNNIYYLITSTL